MLETVAMNETRKCQVCKETKSIDDFGYQNRKLGKRKYLCISCDTARQRAFYLKNKAALLAYKKTYYEENKPMLLDKQSSYRKSNPEKVKEQFDAWRANSPEVVKANSKKRKARMRGAGIKKITPKEIKNLLAQKCFYCQQNDATQIDHVVPVARGGTHSIGNLLPACTSCNSSKNKWFITEWKMLKMKRGSKF
jgi:5-methylcytosine-specific restriction endonuclease McrA